MCIFKVHNVSQWPNLRHLAEPLGGAVGLRRKVSAEVELRMVEGSEFQTVGAAMLKPREPTKDWCWQNAENVWD